MKENSVETVSPSVEPKVNNEKDFKDQNESTENASGSSSKTRRNRKRKGKNNPLNKTDDEIKPLPKTETIENKESAAVKRKSKSKSKKNFNAPNKSSDVEKEDSKPLEKKTETQPRTENDSVIPVSMAATKGVNSSDSGSENNKGSEIAVENGTSNSNKKKNKRKQKNKSVNKEEPQVDQKEVSSETKSFTVDYKSLKDALAETLDLEDTISTIHFAPLSSAKLKFQEKPLPLFSKSAPSSVDSSRVSNKSSPSAKNRHAEIPPPPSLTATKKVKSVKSSTQEKSTINKIKSSNSKSPKSKSVATEIEFQDLSSSKKKKNKEIVNPEAYVVEDTKVEQKRSKKEIKEVKKGNGQQGYCHPNDAVQNVRGRRKRYEAYLDPKIYNEKVSEGIFFKGVIRVNKRNRSEAYVTCDNMDSDIFISSIHDRNRALDGDTVVVELIDVDKVWNKKVEVMKQKHQERHSTAIESIPMDEADDNKNKPKYAGKVVGIPIPSKNTTCSGILSIDRGGFGQTSELNDDDLSDTENDQAPETKNVTQTDGSAVKEKTNSTGASNNKDVRLVWFKPIDIKKPLIAIPLRDAPADILQNEEKYRKLLMVAEITRWPLDSIQPFGRVLRELGHIGNIPAETKAVLEDYGIFERPYGTKSLKCLPNTPWSISEDEISKRRDLRNMRIFTIDPSTAKDLDDAVHVLKLGENEFEVGVHIADVSHFVKQHTALDHEAFDRGTSTYLCDRVIPMLPSLLCEELCSLNPNVDRLAFSVIWQMDGEGNIKDTWFGKTVIRSCAKLAYEDAQSVIENKGLPKDVTIGSFDRSEVEKDISYLYNISKFMRKRRYENGALSIHSIRLNFKLNELGEPCGISVYEQKDSNRLIEEFMLCANMSVAKKICTHYPKEALLRNHTEPHDKALNEFIQICEKLGYQFDGSSAGSLQKSFEAIESEDVKSVLRLLAVKPMQRAKYFCTGTTDISKYRHYALNVPLYTHFTSPIRRFPDIIVHRQLEAALSNKTNCGYKKDAIKKAANHCNERKEGAKNAQDANIQLYLMHYLHMLETETKRPVICSAIVTQVLKDCFDVLIPEYGIERRIHMDALPVNRFEHNQSKAYLSVFWKEGIEATRRYDEKRKTDKNYVEPSGIQISTDQDPTDTSKTEVTAKGSNQVADESTVDKERKIQTFKTFSTISVRVQVNVERSPPVVFVYPVNPFV